MKTVILVPYVASLKNTSLPTAEAKFLYEDHFTEAEQIQILGDGLEGRLYVKDDVGLYIIGEGKTNASIYCTALLNNKSLNFSDTKFILFGCCGCTKGNGVVGDIYLIAETVDYELGHHVDIRDTEDNKPTWYPNESFSRFGYVNLENDFLEKTYNQIKDVKPKTTQNAKDFMAKTFINEDWALRDPKVLKGVSVTSDSYWKGTYDHLNAHHVVDHYKCKYPFLATDMEDISVAQVFKNYNLVDKLLILRFAVNTDVFMKGQSPDTIWGEGRGSFDSSSFDSFDDIFPAASKCASEIVWSII